MRAQEFILENKDLGTIVKSFVNSPAGQKYRQHDCKTVTRAFVDWADQNRIPTQVISLAPPSAAFIEKNPRFRGKSGEGDAHIMPVVAGNAIDFTVRQFGVGRPFEDPLITPINSMKSVYGRFGYFTDAPEWFLGGKSYWMGPLRAIPREIFNQDFGDEILEHGVAENFADMHDEEGQFDANPATYDLPRRALNVPELIKRGAIFIVDPHGPDGWEPDSEGFSLVTLWNVMRGGWPAEAKQHLRPNMYPVAAKMLNRQGPGTMLYDGKYRQILWSIKKLGIPEEVAFLDVKENFADGKVSGKSRPGRVKRAGASCKGSITDLRARAKKYGGERGRMYHWCANMKSGRRKSK